MSKSVIKQRLQNMPTLGISASLRIFVLFFCCLAGVSGYGDFDDSRLAGQVTDASFQINQDSSPPGQAQLTSAADAALLSSRHWSAGQARLPASGPAGDPSDNSVAAAPTNHLEPFGINTTAQGYAPGSFVRVSSIYNSAWSPRSPPVAS